MKKKCIIIFLCLLLCNILTVSSELDINSSDRNDQKYTNSNNDEILDQNSPFGSCGTWNTFMAQSFRPTVETISKVELALYKLEGATGTYTVSIRDSLYGENLISKSLSVDEIPLSHEASWIEFDIEDIEIIPNKKYFIITTMNDGERPENVVLWFLSYNNPYRHGRPWSYGTMPIWIPTFLIIRKIPDLSFRTYGYNRGC